MYLSLILSPSKIYLDNVTCPQYCMRVICSHNVLARNNVSKLCLYNVVRNILHIRGTLQTCAVWSVLNKAQYMLVPCGLSLIKLNTFLCRVVCP